jgi:hypothetical protein
MKKKMCVSVRLGSAKLDALFVDTHHQGHSTALDPSDMREGNAIVDRCAYDLLASVWFFILFLN